MKFVFVKPNYGLCNRMRTIVGANELAKKLNRKLVVIWVRNKDLNAEFSNLFDNKEIIVLETKDGSFYLWLIWKILKLVFNCNVIFDNWIEQNVYNGQKEWIKQIEDRNVFIDSCCDIIRGGDYSIFKVNKKIINDYVLNCKANVIGIHIRRTDNELSIKHSPTCMFVERMKSEIGNNPEIRFYLSTDDPCEEQCFLKIFGDRIIIHNKTSLNRNMPIAIVDACIDLYNLSQCSRIYGSYYSSFSDVAALWGGIKKEEIYLCD